MGNAKHITLGVVAFLFAVLASASAQIRLGDNTQISNVTGNVNIDYARASGTGQVSNNSLGVTGNVGLNGFYFSPRFLNFGAGVFYGRTKTDAGIETLSHAYGFSGSAAIFSGSHYPGLITYAKSINTSNVFSTLGSQGLQSHGDNNTLSINWAERIPHVIPLQLNYVNTKSSQNIYGTSAKSHFQIYTLSVNTNFRLHGFHIYTGYTRSGSHSSIPQTLTNLQSNSMGNNHSQNINLDTSHPLPFLRGTVAGSFGWSNFHYDYATPTAGGANPFTISGSGGGHTYRAGAVATFFPMQWVTSVHSLQYTSNLLGSISQTLLQAGSLNPGLRLTSTNSHALTYDNSEAVTLLHRILVSFNFDHVQQTYAGATFTSNRYSVTASSQYQRPLFGLLTYYAGVTDQANNEGNQGASLTSGVSMSRYIGTWQIGSSFNYSQNVRTILTIANTSSLSYNANLLHRFSRYMYWSVNFSGFHTGISPVVGTSAHSETYNSSLNYRRFGVAGGYSKSSGTSLLTANGVVSAPTPVTSPILLPTQYIITNARVYSISGSATPIPRLTITTNLTDVKMSNGAVLRTNPVLSTSTLSTTYFQYQARRMTFFGGYTRLHQGVSSAGSLPADYNTFFIGITRWFKFL